MLFLAFINHMRLSYLDLELYPEKDCQVVSIFFKYLGIVFFASTVTTTTVRITETTTTSVKITVWGIL